MTVRPWNLETDGPYPVKADGVVAVHLRVIDASGDEFYAVSSRPDSRGFRKLKRVVDSEALKKGKALLAKSREEREDES